MPAKNRIKQYLDGGYYHLYNRGVEKRNIFIDEQDHSVLLSYLKEYLLPKNEKSLCERLVDSSISPKEKDKILKLLRMNNFFDEIIFLVYCLMPNHFHFLIKQKSATSIDKFMNSLGTRYTMYFNRKYKRIGALYQGIYKAVLITTDEQLLELSRYIHKQALEGGHPSSYLEYLEKRKTEWVKPEEIVSYFSKTNPRLSYKSFIEKEENLNVIERQLLE